MGANDRSIPVPSGDGTAGPRIARVEIGGRALWVELRGDDVIEIGDRFDSPHRGAVIAQVSDVRFLPPIESHNQIIGIMGNFTKRTDRRGPGIFIKPITTINAYGADVLWPADVPNVCMESELAVVIGKTAKNLSEAEALDCVFGYTVANDVTSFGVIQEEGVSSHSTRFKMYDTFLPLGPWIVTGITADHRRLTSRLNGQPKQDILLTELDFNVAQTVSWISRVLTLRPGDVISMGTPPGFGDMADGDIVECEIEGIGVLTNRIVKI